MLLIKITAALVCVFCAALIRGLTKAAGDADRAAQQFVIPTPPPGQEVPRELLRAGARPFIVKKNR